MAGLFKGANSTRSPGRIQAALALNPAHFQGRVYFLLSPAAAKIAGRNANPESLAMDIVFIHDLQIETVIGIYDWERKIRQTISLDLEMATDIKKAAKSDDIDDTLSYKTVAKRLIEFVENSEYELVEALAEEICSIVRNEFGVPWVKLTLRKPGAVRGSRAVGVIIERGERAA
jgi:dihydroneopterin aldolase